LLVAEELERNPDFKLDTVVEISPAAAAVESRHFNAGEKLTVKDLLFAMMISSSNDAATQAGITLGGDTASFVKKMNERAAAMGLTGVNFNSPSGLLQGGARENSMASCEAIVHLCEAVMKYNAVMEPAGESYAKLSGGRELYTTNGLLKHPTKARPYWRKVPGLFGFKTGYTKAAGCCLAFGVTRKGRTVIGCVTGFPSSADRERFCSDLIEWAYKN
jgi:D-alanyl-D-alanine carboxypeptidase (penicillin-binding protein 5/6)